MPRIGINQKPYYNTDEIANALDADDVFNCYLEPMPEVGYGVRRRPGLKPFANLGTGAPGDGLFEWEAKGLLIAVSNGRVFTVNSAGEETDITSAPLVPRVPVRFAAGSKADSTPFLYMANGKLVYSEDGDDTLEPDDVAAPTTATFVTYLNLKFLANVPGTNRFLFTDVDPGGAAVIDPLYWSSSSNPLTAEAQGDNLLALTEYLQEIQAWGSQSLETWIDDGSSPFVPLPQAAADLGLLAPYSIVQADNALLALCVIEGARVVVKLTGRTPQVVSKPIGNLLAGYAKVDDAIGQVVSVGDMHQYILQLPSEGVTWAYDIKHDLWTRWGTWNTAVGRMEPFIGQHSCYVKMWNRHLIMSSVDGQIYEFDRGTFTDGGEPVKSFRRTPWQDHGTGARKRSNRLRIKIKRGASATGRAFLRFADDGAEEFSPYVPLELGPVGRRDFMADLTRLGIYHSRKYEISITDDADLCVVWMDEEAERLRS